MSDENHYQKRQQQELTRIALKDDINIELLLSDTGVNSDSVRKHLEKMIVYYWGKDKKEQAYALLLMLRMTLVQLHQEIEQNPDTYNFIESYLNDLQMLLDDLGFDV